LGRGAKTRTEAMHLLENALASGAALDVFRRLVRAQGGDVRVIDDVTRLPQSKLRKSVSASRTGYVTGIDARALGLLAIELGAGRTRVDQKLDYAAGFELHVGVGSYVERGAPLVTIHAGSSALAKRVATSTARAFTLSPKRPAARRLVLARLG
jgi:pyrimidine-nucleoside phosphorylase